ncbi:MAG TPA: cell division protein FtsQ/DivIB [Gallionella sp.]|nr:cell division protein FtsQ/DivIB [Gallionella sp.]
MWDNAPLLRSLANALIASSVVAILYGGVHYLVHLPGLFPLQRVKLLDAPQKVDAAAVSQVIGNEVQGNFFTVDIERLRDSLEKLPWVRHASIRREFPHSLEVQLEEYQALARWNDSALVDAQGEVFDATSDRKMPEFIGQEGTAAEVTQRYEQFSQQLALLDLQVTRLVLSPRHAWQLNLSNGMVLELGREDMLQRLERFVQAYPNSLAAIQGRVKYVDLRYSNGFAVSGLANRG